LFLLAILIVWLGLVALWVAAIVSVIRFSSGAFRAVDRSMGSTIALVVLTGWLGAIYYWLVIRRELEPYRNAAADNRGHSSYA
jgi:hypothetical protein